MINVQIGRIQNATRVLGKSQGYLSLPVRDEIHDGTPVMVTAWHPTPKEIEALQAGASVYLHILGTAHPPVYMTVGAETTEA